MSSTWEEMRGGRPCPLCSPRPDYSEFHYLVERLSSSTLYLLRNQQYYGHCTLVYDVRHARRPDDLTLDEWAVMARELWIAVRAITQALAPDHMNIESLGNEVPHLHWHLVPRRRNDGRWGGPIWTTRADAMPKALLSDAQYAELASSIKMRIDVAREPAGQPA